MYLKTLERFYLIKIIFFPIIIKALITLSQDIYFKALKSIEILLLTNLFLKNNRL